MLIFYHTGATLALQWWKPRDYQQIITATGKKVKTVKRKNSASKKSPQCGQNSQNFYAILKEESWGIDKTGGFVSSTIV